jgi:Fe-S-cluster containining protein
MVDLSEAEPARAEAIRRRAESAWVRLAASYPGDAESGVLVDEFDEAEFAERFSDLACPALDPQSGQCSLYGARPIACRTYGLPSRLDGEDLPPCPLCFRRASPDEIEEARMILDTRDWNMSHWENKDTMSLDRTTIAFALSQSTCKR